MKRFATLAAVVTLCLAAHPSAMAGSLPVIDTAVLTQSIHQVAAWAQQYQQMQAQILQLRQTQASMTGDRGMAGLLGNQNRGYLPPNWNAAMTTLNSGGTSYSQLASVAQQIKQSQAVLSQQEISSLSPQMQQYLEQTRNLAASQQAIGQSAYNTAAQRVNTLQTLTNALNGQTDPKAVMDLQARIASEQAALANDQAQLQSVAQLTAAQSAAQQSMTNELRAQSSGSGNFPRLNTSPPF